MDKQRKRILNLGVTALLTSVTIAVGVYYYYSQSKTKTNPTSQRVKSYTNKPVTIIFTESVLSSQLPINEILKKTQNVIFISPIEVELNLDESIRYKFIYCETEIGLWSIVKHLQSETVFVVPDDLQMDIPIDLKRFIGSVIELDQNSAVINENILSFIIS